jgi:hypothetical protein
MSDNLECSAAPRTVTVELGTPILELARRIQPLRDHRVTIDQNFVFCEELPEKGFASLINRPRLVVVLVLERPSHVWRTLAHPVLLRIKALDQFREHGHNTYQHFFAGLNSFRKSKSFVRHQFSRRSEHKDDDEYDTLVVTPPRCVLCAIQGAGPGGTGSQSSVTSGGPQTSSSACRTPILAFSDSIFLAASSAAMRCGICELQFPSQASTVMTMACSGRAR